MDVGKNRNKERERKMKVTTELEIDGKRWEAFYKLARVIIEWEREDYDFLAFVTAVQSILEVERKFAFAIVNNLSYEANPADAVCFSYERLYRSTAKLKVV